MSIPQNADVFPQHDGSVLINSKSIRVPGIDLKQEISRGKNGVVIRGFDTYLDRAVAVKFWLKLKPQDTRDKFQQGMLEARKAAAARGAHVVEVYSAGETEGLFYTTMEFFAGLTLRVWLTSEIITPRQLPDNESDGLAFFTRWIFTRRLVESLKRLHFTGILHGDLHPDNVLVGSAFSTDRDEPTFNDRDFRVIDFGTSHFTSNAFSASRHWRVLEQCVDSILQPFQLKPIWGHCRPEPSSSGKQWHNWFASYLAYLPLMIYQILNPDYARRDLGMIVNLDWDETGEDRHLVALSEDAREFIGAMSTAGCLNTRDLRQLSDFHQAVKGIRPSWDDTDRRPWLPPLKHPSG
jgi:serine/threonine protein kinase